MQNRAHFLVGHLARSVRRCRAGTCRPTCALNGPSKIDVHGRMRTERARDHVLGNVGRHVGLGHLPGGRHFPHQAVIERQLLEQSPRSRYTRLSPMWATSAPCGNSTRQLHVVPMP